jgi:SAM-dependent methyltransferase
LDAKTKFCEGFSVQVWPEEDALEQIRSYNVRPAMETVSICDNCGKGLAGQRVEGMGEISLLRCRCGLVTTCPRPDPEELGAYYPETYYSYVPQTLSRKKKILRKLRTYKGRYPSRDGWLARKFWRVAASLVGNLFLSYVPYRGTGKRLLEIGCGTGDDLIWAREMGWEVSGIEIGEKATQVAQDRGLDVQCSQFENANLTRDHFDCIVMTQVLEHLYSPKAALRRCHELLRPNGTLLISVPKFDSWPRRALGDCWQGLWFPIHLHHFDQAVLETMIRDAGFCVHEVRLSSGLLSLFYALRTMAQCRVFPRLLTPTTGDSIGDIMLVVAEKRGLVPSSS